MSEAKLSKYAAKQAAKAKGQWTPPESIVPVETVSDVPETPAPKKSNEHEEGRFSSRPKRNPDAPRVVDLGDLPRQLVERLDNIVGEADGALALCDAISDASSAARLGIQSNEAYGIAGCLRATISRALDCKARAERLPNVPRQGGAK